LKLTIRRTAQFKRDIKRLLRSGKDIEKLLSIVEELAEGRKYEMGLEELNKTLRKLENLPNYEEAKLCLGYLGVLILKSVS
jgi:hypothetical protein